MPDSLLQRIEKLERTVTQLQSDLSQTSAQLSRVKSSFGVAYANFVVSTTSGPYIAPKGGTATHSLSFSIPAGTRISSVWYQPTDNIAVITSFLRIVLSISGTNTVDMELGAHSDGDMRILVHALYVPV